MIARLHGTVHRQKLSDVIVDVQGVGYLVSTPVDVWEKLEDGTSATLWIHTYVREDRLELYGFQDRASRTLFELLIAQSGIGPKLGLELCAVPRDMLLQAVNQKDASILTNVKGIGKKTAEKLLLELENAIEKQPDVFGSAAAQTAGKHEYDQDAVSALTTLGYDTSTIMQALKNLPSDIETTEERVAAALRSL